MKKLFLVLLALSMWSAAEVKAHNAGREHNAPRREISHKHHHSSSCQVEVLREFLHAMAHHDCHCNHKPHPQCDRGGNHHRPPQIHQGKPYRPSSPQPHRPSHTGNAPHRGSSHPTPPAHSPRR